MLKMGKIMPFAMQTRKPKAKRPSKKNNIGGDNKFSTKKENNSTMLDIFYLN